MSSAGQQLVAGRIPGEEVELATITADSAAAVTETVAITVMVPVVDGRTYKVVFDTALESGTPGDRMLARIREDGLVGTALQTRQVTRSASPGTTGDPVHAEGRFTATTTQNKTFVGTHEGVSGAGAVNAAAAAAFPTLLYVEYVRG